MQDLRTKRHVVYSLHLHLVFVTKYRKKVFSEKMYERLHYHFERVCGDFGCKLIESSGQKDHVHLLVEPLPHTTPSKLVNSLKGVSSRFLRQEFGYRRARRLCSRTETVLLERRIMVSELFHCILWWSTTGHCQKIY